MAIGWFGVMDIALKTLSGQLYWNSWLTDTIAATDTTSEDGGRRLREAERCYNWDHGMVEMRDAEDARHPCHSFAIFVAQKWIQ